MKKLLFAPLSPFSPWLAFQTVLVLHQSSMLVCMPSQPCRWWPVQPVEKQPVCVCVCAGLFVRVPLCGKEQSKGIWPLYKAQSESTGQHCLQMLHNHKFLSICGPRLWSAERESQANDWIHILPPENPQNLFLSVCQQAHPNFDWVHHSVLSISSAETMIQTFAAAVCLDWGKRCCVILS